MRLYGIQRALVTYLLYSTMVSVVTGRLFTVDQRERMDGRCGFRGGDELLTNDFIICRQQVEPLEVHE
jgi:hypothetical protein